MSKANNTLLYVGLGAAALIGGALVYNMLTKESSSASLVFDEIDELGPAQRDPNGMLSFKYYKDVFSVISKHAKSKFADEKKELVIKRRRALKESDNKTYRELVKEMI